MNQKPLATFKAFSHTKIDLLWPVTINAWPIDLPLLSFQLPMA